MDGDSPLLGLIPDSAPESAPNAPQQATMAPLPNGYWGNVAGSLVNALAGAAGYATRDPILEQHAMTNQDLNQRMSMLGPVNDIKAGIQQKISDRDYAGAFALYQQNARLATIDPTFAKMGSDLAGTMASLKQRTNDVGMVTGMPGYTPEEKAVIQQQLLNGSPLADALKTINESRQGWDIQPADTEGNVYRTNKATGEQQLLRKSAIKMTPGEQIGRVDEAGFHPSATAMSLVPLTDAEKKGAAVLPGFDQAQFEQNLRSPDILIRQQANAQRAELFKAGQESEAKPMTDGETAKVATDLGIKVKPYLADYTSQEMAAIITKQQALKTQLVVQEQYARAGADNVIQGQKGWMSANNGRFHTEELFDTNTGQQVTADEKWGDVEKRLGTDRALLDKSTGQVVRFAQRGQLVVDQLADLMPKILAANNGNPGANMAQAIKIAVQKHVIPSETIGQWESLQAMAKFDVAATESRGARLLAVQLKTVGEQQVPTTLDTIASGAGKLRVAKNGLENVAGAAFGKPLKTVQQTTLGLNGTGMQATGMSPSGRHVPVLE